ncbi:TetR family transcriptional regulator [Oceanococcus atlanticus]|uniref:TetR family transcriptional regulator n=1 Tax=Oceanococcus atlanticus TaxID=1317117 RepID=A0A1Y1SE18_9GAMM|nr:TetR/AcrR family transcriptional regulator [Oceanococcus atlanticus]ORE87238.1 TetR family transcriptional regulator [Oceanococcus atlanticus]
MTRSSEKSAYHHGNLRAALLDTARSLVQAQGLDGLTLRAVAERLGVSRSAIYRHYSSKDELLGQIIMEGFEQLRAATAEAAQQRAKRTESCPLDQLHHMGLAYIRFAVEHADLYDLMFHPSLIGRSCDTVKMASLRSYEVLTDMLQRCQQAGQIKAGEPHRQAFAIWASLHGLVSLCRGRPPHAVPEATLEGGFEMLLEQLMAGLATQQQWRSVLQTDTSD